MNLQVLPPPPLSPSLSLSLSRACSVSLSRLRALSLSRALAVSLSLEGCGLERGCVNSPGVENHQDLTVSNTVGTHAGPWIFSPIVIHLVVTSCRENSPLQPFGQGLGLRTAPCNPEPQTLNP